MKIAFYAPLKSPDHPVPSGDRLMARQLMAALRLAGHEVELASSLRAFHATPDTRLEGFEAAIEAEAERLRVLWRVGGKPDLWFCYHPYYKAPDRLGPMLSREFGLAYVTAEASYSHRRNLGIWGEFQVELRETVAQADANLHFTNRDARGLAEAVPQARLETFFPFIDADPFLRRMPQPEDGRLVTVAMMRPGDKLSSYRALAAALRHLPPTGWTLTVIGDGSARAEVEACFAGLDDGRLDWRGQMSGEEVAQELSRASLFVWPGHGEAYGLSYLEAQAAGLPVIAEAVAGVPEVVVHGETGWLVPPDDAVAFADAITALLGNAARRQSMGQAARRFVMEKRSLGAAARRLEEILRRVRNG
ncbi:glycosyltransferase family 4 protein [Allorhizobium undicola]|uniref:glycosyltransferase family 4 protein n=1 Tax=Allorhizobium undicola TaxID=78527 RepID=UPI003D32CCC4